VKFTIKDMFTGEGFASALDADTSEGEGTFYIWKMDELHQLFKEDDLKFVAFYFDASHKGNFEDGQNVLSIPFDDEIVMEKMGLDEDRFREKCTKIMKMLTRARVMREPPSMDQKAITSWNAIMATALLKAWEINGDYSWLDKAKFILKKLLKFAEKKNVPRVLDGDRPGFLDDHVFASQALLQGFLSTEDSEYLKASGDILELTIDRFYDKEKGALSFTPLEQGFQLDDVYDHELPSSTSEFIQLLLKHHVIQMKNEYQELAEGFLAVHQKTWRSPSPGAAHLLCALDTLLGPLRVAVVTDGKGFKEMLATLRDDFDPNLLTLILDEKAKIPIFEGRKPLKGKATVYLCKGQTCKEPITDPKKMVKIMRTFT
jgi:uncharacterized protein YyaL (SSP411 family)